METVVYLLVPAALTSTGFTQIATISSPLTPSLAPRPTDMTIRNAMPGDWPPSPQRQLGGPSVTRSQIASSMMSILRRLRRHFGADKLDLVLVVRGHKLQFSLQPPRIRVIGNREVLTRRLVVFMKNSHTDGTLYHATLDHYAGRGRSGRALVERVNLTTADFSAVGEPATLFVTTGGQRRALPAAAFLAMAYSRRNRRAYEFD